MTTQTQILVLKPEEVLTFDRNSNASLELTNPSPYSVCYKIKTTASRKYCVKPRLGLLMPYSSSPVNFRLKSGRTEETDKFKVLSAVVPSNVRESDPSKMWEFINEEGTMQSKLRVKCVDSADDEMDYTLQTSKTSIIKNKLFLLMICAITAVGLAAYYICPNTRY